MCEMRNNLEVDADMKMDLSGNTNQWQPLLNITTNFWLPYLVENFSRCQNNIKLYDCLS